MSAAKKLGHVLGQEIIARRGTYSPVEMIMKQEVDCPQVRQFESILS
jgi:hypothetical protein